jgi:hypothetical protein
MQLLSLDICASDYQRFGNLVPYDIILPILVVPRYIHFV